MQLLIIFGLGNDLFLVKGWFHPHLILIACSGPVGNLFNRIHLNRSLANDHTSWTEPGEINTIPPLPHLSRFITFNSLS